MDIAIENPGSFFSLFYVLAFAFVYVMVIYKSIRWGFHLRSVLLMLTTTTLCTVLGSKLFTIPVTEWVYALQANSHVFTNRSAVGALILAVTGLIISQRIFGFNRPILDLYAWLGPIVLGIIKLGCFLNGCCYGRGTEALWGVRYPTGTPAHFNHWSEGVMEPGMAMSVPVHPVQLYESMALFFIGFIIFRTHKHWNKNLSSILLVTVLFLIMRFSLMFFRDPDSLQFNQVYYFGLNLYQWSMLGGGILMTAVFLFYEKFLQIDWIKGRQNGPYLHADAIYIVFISALLFAFKDLFSFYENIVIWIKFLPAILLSLYYFYTDKRLQPYRWVTSMIVLLPFYVLAQTIPDQKQVINKYHRVDVGGSFGNFSNEVLYNPRSTECGTSYSGQYFESTYWVAGGGYSQIVEKEKTKFTYGANISAGQVSSSGLTTEFSGSKFIFAVNPFVKADRKWYGAGIGFQLGQIPSNNEERIEASNFENAVNTNTFLPELYLRLGPKKYLDADFNYGFLHPSAFPTVFARASIGSGFGISDNYSLRYGRILNLDTNYISAEALITPQLGINVMYIFKEDDPYIPDYQSNSKVVFSLNYRFGQNN
ncbi:prolipoprotein diacylglyceryl transferase [Robertkochia flava]|uniref:prolipoprotein diacylglyceryl transferase n=1 Tax=Robertkochia flava TaxID=3447986 RepID=UPI001CCB2649|nr:prolipoprotein diacylglyceryl transferase family protein [Robertkochia marina]